MLFVITGASGSGKSEYAERLICGLAARDKISEKIYMATMENKGAEAVERIMRHQRLRAGKGFTTVEAPFGFSDRAVISQTKNAAVLLECTSNLLANLIFSGGMTARQAEQEILFQVRRAADSYGHIVVVTNEIFSDGKIYTGEMQEYISALGCVNCRLAAASDVFCEVVYTIPVFLKGEKICRF